MSNPDPTPPAVLYAARSASEERDGRESTTSQLEASKGIDRAIR